MNDGVGEAGAGGDEGAHFHQLFGLLIELRSISFNHRVVSSLGCQETRIVDARPALLDRTIGSSLAIEGLSQSHRSVPQTLHRCFWRSGDVDAFVEVEVEHLTV